MTSIGNRLREAREFQAMTQEELAQASGVKVVTISRIENNRQLSRPRLSTIRKLAEVLKVDPAYILFGDRADLKTAA